MSQSENNAHEKKYEIVVNGQQEIVADKTVSYEQVVAFAYPTPPSADAVITVTYRGAQKPKEGSLKPGGTVDVRKDGAVFNVTSTTKS
ncbi:multiubiquitin domain-containing protein [Agromyces subbeticus]|uniref:multiubiquitin domain-containing protein n=1 Tax=Agromyces subbeticus TaxID=293890 RepID=UPI0003B38382|nr:multiubiquitin domain-containing protein [Agromyces subbeticus]